MTPKHKPPRAGDCGRLRRVVWEPVALLRVYDPGDAWHIIGGTSFGADEALLLVKDVKADFLEHRAKEIHRLELKSGKGELWVRLPDDLFVSDIDWIDESPTSSEQAGRLTPSR